MHFKVGVYEALGLLFLTSMPVIIGHAGSYLIWRNSKTLNQYKYSEIYDNWTQGHGIITEIPSEYQTLHNDPDFIRILKLARSSIIAFISLILLLMLSPIIIRIVA